MVVLKNHKRHLDMLHSLRRLLSPIGVVVVQKQYSRIRELCLESFGLLFGFDSGTDDNELMHWVLHNRL
jgi:hypothetical protein